METNPETATNLDFLRNFTGGDQSRMNKYMNMFLSATPSQVDTIRQSVESSNLDLIRATAHSLRPQMTYMGIKKGEMLLKQIEENILEQKNTESIPSLVNEFSRIFDTACEELKANLK